MSNSTNFKRTFHKSLAILAISGGLVTNVSSQNILFNNGALVYTAPLAIVQVNGGFQNDGAAGTTPTFENNGTMTIATSGTPGSVLLTNGSTLQGNGTYFVEQDWTNDATFTANNSTVNFDGNLQEFITSTIGTATTFNNLILTGTGVGVNAKKTLQLVNANIGAAGTLTINDRELETQTNTMFVLNPSTTCVTNNTTPGSEGFVSSSVGGSLSRVTNSVAMYIYPTGSSVGTTRYRPVQLTPVSASADTYTARLGNNNATADGFNTASLDSTMCIVNPLFYHQITRSAGTDNAGIDIFYNLAADGGWDGMAQWNTPTAALWNGMGAVTATAGVPLNDVLKANWNDFTSSPYILSHQKPAMPVLACTPVCANSSGNTFSATGTGTTFTWTSPAGTTIASGQGTNSVTVNWNATSGPISVTTTSGLGCASTPASCSVTVTPIPVANFDTSSIGFDYNFTDLSTGGATQWAWNFGDGGTSTAQNPSHDYTATGPETVCLVASNSGCADTTCRVLNIDATVFINIPNVFTPDGDGVNDEFYINSSGLKDFKIEIYNRWGLKVFETESPNVKWDGRSTAGVPLSDGTYYFILKAVSSVNNKDYSTTGFVQLLRK